MPLVSQVYQSRWLKAEDLHGKSVRVKIANVEVESVRQRDGDVTPKIAVSFVGARKVLLCNATQARTLAGLFGDNTDDWIEKEISIGPERLANGKETIKVGK